MIVTRVAWREKREAEANLEVKEIRFTKKEMTEVEANLTEIVKTEVIAKVIEIVMTVVEVKEMMMEDIIVTGTEIGIQKKGTERREGLQIEKTEEGIQEMTEMVSDPFMTDLAIAVVTGTETEEDTIENQVVEGPTSDNLGHSIVQIFSNLTIAVNC